MMSMTLLAIDRSIRQANLLQGKLYYLHDGYREHGISGSSNFTHSGLGLSVTPNIELNLIVDSDRVYQHGLS